MDSHKTTEGFAIRISRTGAALAPKVSPLFFAMFGSRVLFLGLALSGVVGPVAAQLPTPCGAGTCGAAGPTAWVSSGAASAALSGSTLAIRQQSDSATLNWASFDIGPSNAVTFEQPSNDAVALNRIFQADPAKIFGSLNANGRVFLLSQNGILFGEGAKVDVGGLIASTLELSPAALELGLARAVERDQPAFQTFANGAPSGSIEVQRGARITTADGGQILMFAPEIENHGTLQAPEGQALLAAGQSVYLAASTDQNLRGFLVQVDNAGPVTNGAMDGSEVGTATIAAPRGNVTLAGLAVNQNGRVSSTTAVQQNGSIRLLAQEGKLVSQGGPGTPLPTRNGALTLAADSRTEVLPEVDSDERAVDATVQLRSSIYLEGEQVAVRSGAVVRAPSGEVTLIARAHPILEPGLFEEPSDTSRLVVENDAVIDVAGLDIELPVERNLVQVELRGNQLRDSPVQRDGALRSKKVTVDIRRRGVRADGTSWQGTPIADASGEISTVQRTVAERSVTGGSVTLQSEGGLFVRDGATIDVSGGQIAYQPGVIETSQLLGADGRVYDVADADPDRVYTGIVGSFTREHTRWGVTEVFPGFASQRPGRLDPGYVEGKDAGSISLLAFDAIIGGDLRANAVRGPYQRFLPDGTNESDFDRIPRGGLLRVGSQAGLVGNGGFPNYVTPRLTIDETAVQLGAGFDYLASPLPEGVEGITLRPELLRTSGIRTLQAFVNGEFTLPAGIALDFPAGGGLEVVAGSAAVLGDVAAAGGEIGVRTRQTSTTTVEASRLTLGADAVLSTAGLWTNDSPLLNPNGPTSIVVLEGGSVQLAVDAGRLAAEAGSRIDVSGGLWRDAGGHYHAGAGGAVDIAARPAASAEKAIELRTSLVGFGAFEGGAVRLAFPTICVSCDDPDVDFVADDEWFASGGFADRSLRSLGGDLVVAPQSEVRLRQQNLLLGDDASRVPSGTSLFDFLLLGTLPDYLRRPVDLDLTGASVRVERGAHIAADPLAAIGFTAGSQIVVEGAITAPAGHVDMLIESGGATAEFDPSQGIWLGSTAKLALMGVSRRTPNDLGILTGDVLAGGAATLRADRGYIVTAPGSAIDVSGAVADVDILTNVDQRQSYARTAIGSNAGAIDLTAAEGMTLGGALVGRPGAPTAFGGSLSVAVDPTNRKDPGSVESVFPLGHRHLIVSQTLDPLVIGIGGDVPAAFNGQVLIAASGINAGGFDNVQLTARSLLGLNESGTFVASTGEVTFRGNVSLAARRSIAIDSAVISGSGGAVSLAAEHVLLGNRDRRFQDPVVTLTDLDASLEVSGRLIELVGDTSLSGFDRTVLRGGDVRLKGLQTAGARTLTGSLSALGELRIAANQIYPTTLTEYAIRVLDAPAATGSLSIEPAALSFGSPVLSVGGRIELAASSIRQAGVLRAPFGAIDLVAGDLVLDAGSVTSTSGGASLIPFGTVQAGSDWVYELGDQQTLIETDNFPRQTVTLNADAIDFRGGARIDVAGGGDLLAYEFVPGVGGSRDVLSPEVSPESFAIIPALQLPFAPFDPALARGTDIGVGSTVFLAGVGDLPAGEYAVLPARYALLPGAYLVTPVPGYEDIRPIERFARLDGSVVVAGRRGVAGTGIVDSRTSGFAVTTSKLLEREAEYQISRAGAFLDAHQAVAEVTQRLPRDAGTLSILARDRLALVGTLAASAGAGGRGAQLDVASTQLRLVADASAPQSGDEVLVDAAALSALGAESVLLGGTRTSTPEGVRIDTTAASVFFDVASRTTAPELLVAARDALTVRSGAVVESKGSKVDAPEQYLLDGDGAFLRVSTSDPVAFERTGAVGSFGTLTLEAGSTLGAPGSTILDSTLLSVVDGNLSLGGALTLSAAQMTLGSGSSSASGLELTAAQLEALDLTALTLSSQSTIELASDLRLDLPGDLTLDAVSLLGQGSVLTDLRAGNVTLLGRGSIAAPPAAAIGQASLTLTGRDGLSLGAGALAASGWANVALRSGGRVAATEDGALTAGGALSIAGAKVAAASGVDYLFRAAGELAIGSAPSSAPAAPTVDDEPALGGSLRFTGASIVADGAIELPSGHATFVAESGDIVLLDSAALVVSGRETLFDGVSVASPGGHVSFESHAGSVLIAGNASVNVAGARGGRGGRLDVSAPAGTVSLGGRLIGAVEGVAEGSALLVDGREIGSLDLLADSARAGGFSSELGFRQRGGLGDLLLSADRTLAARTVAVTADKNAVRIFGTIDASGGDRASVVFSGAGGVQLGGRIDARAEKGGDVEIRAANGGIDFAGAASIDVSGVDGGPGGDVRFRAPVALVTQPQPPVTLSGILTGAARASLEAFNAYYEQDGSLSAADLVADATNSRFADAAAVAAQRDALRAAVGRPGDAAFAIVPGIEIRSPSMPGSSPDLALDADWNLAEWRFGGVAGVLTLRAQGNLNFNRTLSDGFQGVTGTARFAQLTDGTSWSYRLAAGADLSSADPLAVVPDYALPLFGGAPRGSLNVAAGTLGSATGISDFRMIRTGTGDIEIATARDLKLGNRASTIYTAGAATNGTALAVLNRLPYPDGGGDVRITAQGDVVGALTNQLVTDWLWRSGRPIGTPLGVAPTAWTVAFQRFEQNVGALGGGDVAIRAGGNVRDLSAVVPSIGRQRGTVAAPQLSIIGGGNLSVTAGGDLSNGTFFVGRGSGTLAAGGSIGPSGNSGVVVALSDGVVDVQARRGVTLETALNPTIITQGRSQPSSNSASFFSTYSPRASLSLQSTAGDVRLVNDTLNSQGWLRRQVADSFTGSIAMSEVSARALGVYPPTLRAAALRGDVEIDDSFTLFPASKGNLELFANDTLRFESTDSIQVLMSDSDPAVLPSVARPSPDILMQWLTRAFNSTTDPLLHAAVPVHSLAAQPDGVPDSDPARLVAKNGDIEFQSQRPDSSIIVLPKQARIVAGRDIHDVSVAVQHTDAADSTTVLAGRDLKYSILRTLAGLLNIVDRRIEVAGPGRLKVIAGRDVDLGAGGGIATNGDLRNPALADRGADVTVLPGLGANGVAIGEFIHRYLEQSGEYAEELAAYLEGIGRGGAGDRVAAFSALPFDEQLPILQSVLLNEIKLSGREAAKAGPTNADFSRAFKALNTLFSGSNPDVDAGEANAYHGDVSLFFSRIYTLDGGSIWILAPGGEINAGLATPPAAFGIVKPPSELGIVAQSDGSIGLLAYGDVLVNESRVFAADGGNILVWSTRGDIDAGRGAKTAISAPPPVITFDELGNLQAKFSPALSGSGIQTLATSEGRKPGDVDLFAPRGVVNAGDAGIVAGNLTIAATAVLGADNISVSGVSVGVPVDTGGFAAALTGVSAVASSASNAAEDTVGAARQAEQTDTPLADQALGFLDVFVTGFGEPGAEGDQGECDPARENCAR